MKSDRIFPGMSSPALMRASPSWTSFRSNKARNTSRRRTRNSQVVDASMLGPPTVEDVFNFENVVVFPFWIAMIGFPKNALTKECMVSPLSSVALGLIYAYLAYASFQEPEILEAFSSGAKQDLSSLTKGFGYETTVAVGWAHFIAMDLLAGRYIFLDGLKNKFTTRHSLALTLFFGPIGVVTHVATRALVGLVRGDVEDILVTGRYSSRDDVDKVRKDD